MKIKNIGSYIEWHCLDALEAGIPIEFDRDDLYLPAELGAVGLDSHIGMRFVQQWTLATDLVRYLQPEQGLLVLRTVIKSMDVEWRG
jgi:hypothetical protein